MRRPSDPADRHSRAALAAIALATALTLACGTTPPPEPERPVALDFVRQFHTARVVTETSRLVFGTPETRQVLAGGWSIDEVWDKQFPFVWATGPVSNVRFRVGQVAPLRLQLRGHPEPFATSPPQQVKIAVNGTPVTSITMRNMAYETYDVAVPASVLREGDNVLELRPARVHHGKSGDARALSVAWAWMDFGGARITAPTVVTGAAPTLQIPCGNDVTFDVRIPPGAHLQLDGSSLEGQPQPRAWARVTWNSGEIESESLAAPAGGRVDRTLNGRGGLARVAFGCDQPASAKSAGRLTVQRPRITEGQPASAGPAKSAARTPVTGRPNVIFYVVDTLRADRLGAYGSTAGLTPQLDAFSRDATTFVTAIAQSGWTRSSVASMFTGRLPWAHGVLGRAAALPVSLPSLPQILKDAGYATVAVSTNEHVSEPFAMDRGFTTFMKLSDAPRPWSPEVHTAFFSWQSQQTPARPFFAYLHVIDPHDPYEAPDARGRRAAARARTSVTTPSPDAIAAALRKAPTLTLEQVRQDLLVRYDAAVAYFDEQFGKFVADLKARHLYDDAIVIVVSDHGEEFMEHGNFGHGHSLYGEIVAVPLLIKWPKRANAGVRVTTPAQHVDLLPTLLDALGLPARNAVDGESLVPFVAQPATAASRTLESYLALDDNEVASIVAEGRHLVWSRPKQCGGRELFDPAGDPGEQRDLSATESIRAGYLVALLRGRMHALKPPADSRTIVMDAELRRRVAAMGYFQGPEGAPAQSGFCDGLAPSAR